MKASPAGNNGLCLAIDQGTTGTTVLAVDETPGAGEAVRGRAYREIPQSFPRPGWVEHAADDLWRSVVEAAGEVCQSGPPPAALGITNQRETIVLWERSTGRPVAPAIVWQDRRTADDCERLRNAGHAERIQRLTGLVIDPYFSATKLAWLLDHVDGARQRAQAGTLAAGTVDAWLLWNLTGGRVHATDVSNAARTMLFDIASRQWSAELCALWNIPLALLPAVKPCAGVLGVTHGVPGVPDGIPVAGMAGDQQAALFGQGCVAPGEAKCTFGTGSFLLMNVGDKPVMSRHRLLGTVAWTIGDETAYALEGSAFVSGALVQWLRDGLGLIARAADVEALASSVPDSGGISIVPALVGLGAPHWRADARGLITGLTRGTTRAHIARAALEAMALQNVELVRAMEEDAGRPLAMLKVDGGASANDLLMQMQADLLGVPVIRPAFVESTALGAARLAAVGIGIRPLDTTLVWADGSGPPATRFEPRLLAAERDAALTRFREAVAKA